jgi:tetratricopeptide (TPR) repeat protein
MKYLLFLIPVLLVSCGGSKSVKADPKDLDSLLVMYPDSVELIVEHGTKMLKEYKFEKAMADGAKAFRLDSNNLDARMLYADVLNNRPERSVSDISTAQRHFKIIVKKQPKNPKALVGLASTYSQQMDFDKSFQYINQALKIDPRYRDAYVMKGSNYLFLNKPDLAKSSYETAVQQDPSFYEAYLMLGSLYQAENNVICIEYYKTAAELQPKNPEVLFSLAYAQQVFEQPEEALTIYRKMIQIDTSYYQALNQIGVIKQYNYKQIDSAIYYYNSALQTEPRFVEAWHNLGMCYEEKGDITRAMQSYAKALKYNPDFKLSRDRADALKNAR